MISTTATGFRANIKHYMDLVIRDSQEVIINRGNEAAVLIPMNQYNSMKETEYLMSSKEMEKAILKGMDDAFSLALTGWSDRNVAAISAFPLLPANFRASSGA